ncbi:MAG: diacylglycerol kinase family protein [Coriobacteriales bacterium]|jgi:diacylglycerol kinase|nr:diacylglycerol kinase family protein [Coriobacteriales bacterium]
MGERPQGLGASLRCAFEGVAYAVRTQRNMRIHLAVAVSVLVVGALVRLNAVEWALVALCIGLVIAGELVNTALEALVDLASPEAHPKAKAAKDAAAAAVLVLSFVSVVVGVLVLANALGRLTA